MPRSSQIDEQRKRLLPSVCQVFSELGYHRTTTAALAKPCKVRENILYRLWRDKKAMFLAAIDAIFEQRARMSAQILAEHPSMDRILESLVRYKARHQGEFGFYRVVFTALAETDDADIRTALKGMYRRFQQLVKEHVDAGRNGLKRSSGLTADTVALAEHLNASRLDKGLIYAEDAIYDCKGEPDWKKMTPSYVPNKYLPRLDLGGEGALKEGISAVHAQGGRGILYIEGWIVNKTSEVGKKHGAEWSVLLRGGT